MKAFVAGATGYTGRAVVEALRDRGVEVVAHARPGSPRLAELAPGFEALGAEVDTTPWQAEALAERLGAVRPELVFGLLGITRAGARREARDKGARPSYESVDHGLTVMLLDACVAAGLAPRFVYLSSLGVGPRARGAYLRSRWKTEEHVRASGVPFTIVRPSFITGADRDEPRPGERVAATVAGGALAVLGALGARRLKRRFAPRTGAELARAMVGAALAEDTAGRVLEADELFDDAPGR